MKFVIAMMLSLTALTCTVAQAEDSSQRLQNLHQVHQQDK